MIARQVIFWSLALSVMVAPAAGFGLPKEFAFEVVDSYGQHVRFYKSITSNNIDELFSGKLPFLGEFGAKAVAVYYEGRDPEVYFFAIGEAEKAHTIHHADVLKAAFKEHGFDFEAAQGFQLQAKKIQGRWRIIGFDISLMSENQETKEELGLSPELQGWLARFVTQRIDRRFIAFSQPNWPTHLPKTWCEIALKSQSFSPLVKAPQ